MRVGIRKKDAMPTVQMKTIFHCPIVFFRYALRDGDGVASSDFGARPVTTCAHSIFQEAMMKKQILPIGGPMKEKWGHFSGRAAFSSAVRVSGGELLFISGQLATDEKLNMIGKGDMGAQTRQVLKNIKSVLDWAGATPSDIVKVTVFVTDISKFREIHDARLEFFDPDHFPASTMVEVKEFVHPDALIEIEAIAVIKGE